MTPRFLLDEDISHRVAEGLRDRGVDTTSVHEIGRTGLPDGEQLAFAASEGRVMVTYNRADYQALDRDWRTQGRNHPGILWCNERIVPRRAIESIIRAIVAAVHQHETLEGLCLPLERADS